MILNNFALLVMKIIFLIKIDATVESKIVWNIKMIHVKFARIHTNFTKIFVLDKKLNLEEIFKVFKVARSLMWKLNYVQNVLMVIILP